MPMGNARCHVDHGFACVKNVYGQSNVKTVGTLALVVNGSSSMNAGGFYPAKTASSKTEGLTCYFGKDLDRLHVLSGVLCVNAGISFHTIRDAIYLFAMDTRDKEKEAGDTEGGEKTVDRRRLCF
ncbi:hypothetical protein DPMN_039487 [Dreissena polymorpha]|uniref:Uncharacterized protein n=1 Tax=Dreissena polymorpha TaxID=45954 RepID=A0A9D4CTB6_DREPO|nr:hypothetical protein DPMN_039487 [Dreissena polymorpha]